MIKAAVFSSFLTVWTVPVFCSLSTVQAQVASETKTFNVRDFGAQGDGVTADTVAFQKTLDRCAVSGGGRVIVPEGRYLIGSIQMGYQTILKLEPNSVIVGSSDPNDYPMIDIRWEGRWQPGRRGLIYTSNVDHTGIIGPGRIQGNPRMAASQNPRGAVVLEPVNCNDVRWEGFTVTQGGNWATHPTFCTDVVIRNVTIRGNRDGIDIDSCRNVLIEGCDIDTGDDCISLKSGRGMNGARIGKPAEDVVIRDCTLRGRVFAGIGIGSETSGGVRNVRIERCKFTCRSFAIYIKTRIGRAGVTESIHGEDIDVLSGGFLRINLTRGGNTNTLDDPVEGLLGYPSARNLSFSNVRLHDASEIVRAVEVAPEKPVQGLSLANITGTAAKGMSLVHIRDLTLKDINVTGCDGPLLTTDDVTGTGLDL